MGKLICVCFLLWCSLSFAGNGAWLGFSFKDLGGAGGKPCSLEVKGVQPKSGAAQAGILEGDLVLTLDGRVITGVPAIKSRVQAAKPGDRIKLGLLRKGKPLNLDLILTERPDDIRSLMGSHVGSKAYAIGNNFYANKAEAHKAPKAVLLDFWATWCGPCRAAIPVMREMYGRYHSKGFDIVGVSSEELAVLQDFQAEEKEPWPLLQDRGGAQSARWGVRAIPTMILVDQNWVVQRQWAGLPSSQELEGAILKVIGDR
jgi:thiol-disulfide isomerase/thioredoxin